MSSTVTFCNSVSIKASPDTREDLRATSLQEGLLTKSQCCLCSCQGLYSRTLSGTRSVSSKNHFKRYCFLSRNHFQFMAFLFANFQLHRPQSQFTQRFFLCPVCPECAETWREGIRLFLWIVEVLEKSQFSDCNALIYSTTRWLYKNPVSIYNQRL